VQSLKRRLALAGLVFLTLNAIGVAGYWYLSGGDASLVDAIYMTVTTLGSVGFGEITKGSSAPAGRIFTIALIYANMVTLVYVTTSLTALLVEGELGRLWEKRRMNKRIESFHNHYIVCGSGSTGIHVVRELCMTERPVLFIEHSDERAHHVLSELEPLTKNRSTLAYLVGDATDDLLLEAAGIKRAHGLVAALPNDKDNLFIVVTAKQLKPDLRIIARASDSGSIDKLRRAGAHSVISPNMIGGMRMVSELVRPSVVTFLDLMLRDKDKAMRIEEVTVSENAAFANKTLREAELRASFNCQVLAVRQKLDSPFDYNPKPDTALTPGLILIVLGDAGNVIRLRQAAAAAA
jgi:voltage-gated potassium channel